MGQITTPLTQEIEGLLDPADNGLVRARLPLLMQWTAPTRRHLSAKERCRLMDLECLLLAKKRSLSLAVRTSAYPPTSDIQNGDIQCTGFVNVFASFSRRFDHGRLILSPLVVVEPGQSRGAEMDSHRMLR